MIPMSEFPMPLTRSMIGRLRFTMISLFNIEDVEKNECVRFYGEIIEI